MPPRFPGVVWLALLVVAAGGWGVTAARLTRIWGADEAAPAVGFAVAVLVAVTIWRWAQGDREQRALAAQRCPRCSDALSAAHVHARPGGVGTGLQRWQCARCGYEHSEALTCAECAA